MTIWAQLRQNFTVFLSKTLPKSFYQMREKQETCRNLNLINSRTPSFADNIFMVTTSALNFKELYIFCKLYPVKRIYVSKRIPYLAQTLTVQAKNIYTLKSLCVSCFTRNKCLKFSYMIGSRFYVIIWDVFRCHVLT